MEEKHMRKESVSEGKRGKKKGRKINNKKGREK